MLYVFYGTDTDASREKARALVERLRGETNEGFFERITADTFEREALTSRIEEAGLFSGDIVTVLDGVCANKDAEETLTDLAGDLALSPNAFVVIEEKISKSVADACEDAKAHVTVSQGSKKEKEWGAAPIFSFADAYARGDRKNAWTMLATLREGGARDEEIIGTLFWRLKTMLLAKDARGAEETGLKPFVFTTARRLAEKYAREDIQKKMDDIVALQYETRRMSGDTAIALERLVLGKRE